MSKTIRDEPTDLPEHPSGLIPPPSRAWHLDREPDESEGDIRHYAGHVPPEQWPACVLRELGRRAGRGQPWRRHHDGAGLDDWGAVPGTTEGQARRYYFGATRGREALRGTIVAESAAAVVAWLRDAELARGYASRDPRRIAGPPSV